MTGSSDNNKVLLVKVKLVTIWVPGSFPFGQTFWSEIPEIVHVKPNGGRAEIRLVNKFACALLDVDDASVHLKIQLK